jgi:hypothetical protein
MGALKQSDPEPQACTVQVKQAYIRKYTQPAANYIEKIEPDYIQAMMNYQIRAIMNYDPIQRRIIIGPDDGMLMPQVLSLVTEAKSSSALEEFKTGIGIIIHTEDDHLSSNAADKVDNIYPMGQSFLAVSNFTKNTKPYEDKTGCKGKEILFTTKDGYEFCMDPLMICKYYAELDSKSAAWAIFTKEMLAELGCPQKDSSKGRGTDNGGKNKGGNGRIFTDEQIEDMVREYMKMLDGFKKGEISAEDLAAAFAKLEAMGIPVPKPNGSDKAKEDLTKG